jgi:integrase
MVNALHGPRHPANMGPEEIRTFLSYLNTDRQIAGSAYSQGLVRIALPLRGSPGAELPWIDGISRAKRPPQRPAVLTQTEVKLVLDRMRGVYQLIARMLYGAGMLLSECAQLRIKDVDLLTVTSARPGRNHRSRNHTPPVCWTTPGISSLSV